MKRRGDRTALGLLIGVLALGILAATYPFFGRHTAWPLSLFGVPAILTAIAAGWQVTLMIAVGSVAVAMVEADPYTGAALWMRIVVVAVNGALALAMSARRSRALDTVSDREEAIALAAAFQRNLAPLPASPPGFVVSTSYRTGERNLHLGGDFFDAVALPDGALAVVIGDVAGHGPLEAAFGAAMRAGWKSAAFGAPHDPLHWMALLKAAFFEDDRFNGFVTMCTGRIEPGGDAVFVSAGHPWPILVHDDAREVPMNVGPPLGFHDIGGSWAVTEFSLAPGGQLLLYTDGLVENRRHPQGDDRGDTVHVVNWLREQLHARPLRRVDLEALLRAFARKGGGYDDDVAVMLITLAGTRRDAAPVRAPPVTSDEAVPRPAAPPSPEPASTQPASTGATPNAGGSSTASCAPGWRRAPCRRWRRTARPGDFRSPTAVRADADASAPSSRRGRGVLPMQ